MTFCMCKKANRDSKGRNVTKKYRAFERHPTKVNVI